MRHFIMITLVVCIMLGMGSGAKAETLLEYQPFQESIEAQLEALDLAQLLGFVELLEQDYQDFLPSLNWRELVSEGRNSREPADLVAVVLKSLLRELYSSLYFLRQLVVIGILAALLQRLSESFGIKAVVELAFAVCFLVLVLLGLQSFRIASSVATASIGNMVEFMHSVLPMLATLLVAVGGITSATVFHPLLWGLVGTIASLVRYLLLPLILMSTAFSLVAHFSSELSFPKVGSLLRQGVITVLGVAFIVFSGFMVVRGAIAPITDGISLRTAKYLTRTFIPIAGGMFADALEVVVGGSLLIKNAIGVFGLLMILFMVATPLLKVWAMVLIYKLVGVLLEPICDRRIVATLGTMESSLTLVAIALGTVAVMFFLAITILVGIGNLAVFMR
ncbi:MAG: stage III sporulation protein AE [Firmicutes bacterium]|nr:stage III sporulation protein AE [Bacillota bacterium]